MTDIYISKLGRSVNIEPRLMPGQLGAMHTDPEREHEATLLTVKMAKIEDRREAYRRARAFLLTEGLPLGLQNKEADPAQWSHTFRVFVKVFLADIAQEQEQR